MCTAQQTLDIQLPLTDTNLRQQFPHIQHSGVDGMKIPDWEHRQPKTPPDPQSRTADRVGRAQTANTERVGRTTREGTR